MRGPKRCNLQADKMVLMECGQRCNARMLGGTAKAWVLWSSGKTVGSGGDATQLADVNIS